jgi:hypothetical protein
MVLRSADKYEQLADRAEARARAVPQSKQYTDVVTFSLQWGQRYG